MIRIEKRRKQAELLVHEFSPLKLITEIVVSTERIALEVRKILNSKGINIPVCVKVDWY